MLESGFSQNPLSWLTPSLGMVDALAPMDVAPPNLQEQTCGKHRKRPAAEDEDMDADSDNPQAAAAAASETRSLLLSALRAPTNPVLLSDSPERAEAEAAGWLIARDGMEFEI